MRPPQWAPASRTERRSARAQRCCATETDREVRLLEQTALARVGEWHRAKKDRNFLQRDRSVGRKSHSLNVKNPEAHRLAQAIADLTGEKLTRAVTEALRERYERLQSRRGKASIEELRAIAKRAAAHVRGPYLDQPEFLYDERGLPR
jgi:antitoxin VapB